MDDLTQLILLESKIKYNNIYEEEEISYPICDTIKEVIFEITNTDNYIDIDEFLPDFTKILKDYFFNKTGFKLNPKNTFDNIIEDNNLDFSTHKLRKDFFNYLMIYYETN